MCKWRKWCKRRKWRKWRKRCKWRNRHERAQCRDQLHLRDGVGLAGHRLHLHEGLAGPFLQAAAHGNGQVEVFTPWRHGLINLLHAALAEHRLVGVACGGLHHEEQHAGGL